MHNTLISTRELAGRLADPAIVVVDVRHDLAAPDAWGETEYRRAHLPGARFAHLDRDLSAPKSGTNGRHPLPAPEACARLFGRLGIDATKQVVAYDQGGSMYAARLWWMLRAAGHDAAAVLDGGYAAWTREGRPVTADIPDVAAATFRPHGSAPAIDAATLSASLDARSMKLVDARGRPRYLGETEPLDPVAGHIPGAINRPYTDNYDAEGRFKTTDRLRAEFEALIAGHASTDVVHYCGSGVSACVNVLAMEHAGLGATRLYPGSWSEWCADPRRPVARGAA